MAVRKSMDEWKPVGQLCPCIEGLGGHTGEVLQGDVSHDLRYCQHRGLRARGDEYPKIGGARGLGRWVLCWDTDPNTVSVV